MSTRSTSSQTASQEVVRRAVVQGTFRSLRIDDTDLRVSVEDQPHRPRPAAVHTAKALANHLPKLERQHRAARTQDLLRGDVIEVQVELSPERSYEFTAVVSSMIDLVGERAEMFGMNESVVGEVRQVHELLSRLLVDLVPIQARVTSHRLVTVDNISWLVDESMIAAGSALDREANEVHLAGVTELPLYWKDVRRVLFAGSAYSIYARLSRPGIQTSWSPVKLADVFDRFLPEVGDQIRELPYLFDHARSIDDRVVALPVSEVFRDNGLVPFGRDLARLASKNISEGELLEAATRAAEAVTTPEELEDAGIVRGAFEEVVQIVQASPSPSETTGTTEPSRIDRQLVRTLREMHQTVARLTFLNALAATAEPERNQKAATANLLEAEVVAIYW